MITQDPMVIAPITLPDILKQTMYDVAHDASDFIGWLESCTDHPFDDEARGIVVNNVMTFIVDVINKSQVRLLAELLSERDKESMLAEIEEYDSIVDATKGFTEEQ